MISKTISKRSDDKSITIYDPDKGLKTIAMAQAGEKHWARAKDATKLFASIESKLIAQAEYVVWRDGVAEIPHAGPGRGRKNQVSVLKRGLPLADPGAVTAHRWRKRLCVTNDEGTRIDEEKLASALNDARMRAVRICEQQNMSTVRGTEGTGEFERYTPPQFIEAAREALGKIDLDPASNPQAQKDVKAKTYFTARDDGLQQEWKGNVFLNPPYHRDLAPLFIDKLVAEFEAGHVKSAVLLTNNCTDTEWFLTAVRSCASVCFTNKRIRFTTPKSGEVLPTQGQAFFYFGPDVKRFEDTFCRVGTCMRPSKQYQPPKEEDEA